MRKNILTALFTLSFFTILDRVLGFLFKIWLSRELGATNLGVYQVALSFFFVLLTATTSGIPLIVSKSTALYRAKNDQKSEGAITSASLIVGTTLALIICALVLIFFIPIKATFTDGQSAIVLLFLLPALIFSAIYSGFRGNLWGRQKYFAVSIVEIIEQIARIIACFLLFLVGVNKLHATAISLSIGCFVSMACVFFCFIRAKGKLCSPKGYILPLIKSSTPITLSRAGSNVTGSLIAIVVPFLLLSSGFSETKALALYGSSVGMALPLLYIPITIVGSLAFVMIPALSESVAKNDYSRVNSQITSATGFSIILSALFVPIFFVLGEQIGLFVYDDLSSGLFLSRSAWLLVPLAVENITSSLMNSLDLEKQSFINYAIGAVLTFVVMFAFYGAFDISVLSFAMGLGWSVSTLLHIRSIKKRTDMSVKPLLFTLLKSVALLFPTVFITKSIFSLCVSLPTFFSLAIPSVVAVLFFSALALVFNLVDIDFFFPSSQRKNFSKKNQKRQAKRLLIK